MRSDDEEGSGGDARCIGGGGGVFFSNDTDRSAINDRRRKRAISLQLVLRIRLGNSWFIRRTGQLRFSQGPSAQVPEPLKTETCADAGNA